MIRLILVRHAVTEWNQSGRYQGHQDVPLGELGRSQARLVAKRLAAEPITASYVSDLLRAHETCEIVLEGRGVPISVTPQLREMSFGDWEGLTHQEVAERFPAEWGAWVRNTVASRPPSGESLFDVKSRLLSLIDRIVKLPAPVPEPRDWFSYRASGAANSPTDQTLLMVSHGGPISVLLTHFLGAPLENYWRFAVRPASVSILEIYPEGAIAEVIGDTSHLT